MAKRGPYGRTPAKPAPARRKTFIKQWRLFRDMTVEALAEAADMSTGNLSAMENGRQGYSDESLANLAAALRTTPGALVDINPQDETTGQFWHIWDQADKEQRRQLAEIAKTIVVAPKTRR